MIEAAVLRGAGLPLAIERLTLEGPRDDEVLVRVAACGICRTDIDYCEGGVSGAAVLGHEGAGIVQELGRAVKGIRRGDHVVLSYQSCGSCEACAADHPAGCRHFWDLNFGFERLDGSSAYEAAGLRGHFFGQSAFATYALATTRNLVKVDKSLPLELLAPLGCGLQTGAGTVLNSLDVKAGRSIAIFGVGAVGLAAVMAARIVGAYPIVAVDLRRRRLALARELGATHTVDPRKADVGARIARITGGGVDHVVEGTGDAALDRTGRALLRPGGSMARLTGGGGMELSEGRSVLGVIQGDAVPQRFIPRLIGLWREGRFPIERLVRVYDFADINRAIADAGSGRTVKAVLRMR
ncbi:MAG: NAD(P)-dependent alcohol dehydrogenase [Hyphomicrobiales bacterium]